ncbi:MAG: 5-bromo-4-chloroindolyl phosphate hydrolysis family protein [Blautia sp.]|nr:5-bromo-4-chloroindolyl phosphate hydrolysis family protein [Blautia sp.]MCM1200298.1 5-bromo-4-chloroindolyl phosphate hydrolysis family protein [Bacteroides fragilis]
MNNNEWQQMGEDIKRQVQNAIDAGDFSRLSKTIGDTVGQAIGGVGKSLNDAVDGVGRSWNDAVGGMGRNPGDTQTGYAVSEQDGRRGAVRRMRPNLRPDSRFFVRKPNGSVSGIVLMAVGFSLFGIAGFCTFMMAVLALFGGESLAAVLAFGIFAAAGAGLGCRGITLKERANRFKRYVSVVQQKMYCSIEELAGKTGRNKKFVLKDVKRMMRNGWFLQAHLDKQESCLIASDEMYEQYRLTQSNYEEQQKAQEEKKREEEQKRQKAQARNGEKADAAENRSEYDKMLEEGQNYIRMIRLCNDEIPGEEMSGKLDKLELLVTRIFDRVEKEPELAPDLHKMLNYYLPTTQKLLEAYRDLEKQNLELNNISSTKREIEATVDTINQAFEKFLDELFREKAWDIQTDISVLHTMLKQDGYLNGDFEKKRESGKEEPNERK